jgi:ribosome biogenesis GTPase
MPDDTTTLAGRIVRAQSGFFEVETAQGTVVAQLRGRLKKPRRSTDVLALGDLVRVRRLDDGSGWIEHVEPRVRVLSRTAPGSKREQVIIANPDQAVFVLACADPDPNLRVLDRLLVVAEREHLQAIVCVNKVDLVYVDEARQVFDLYRKIGYSVVYTSARTKRGLPELRKLLHNRLSVFAGPSGVGKSSLLNALQPGLGLATQEISRGTRKGTHSTVVPQLFRLLEGGYVADTPGLKAFALWDVEPSELDDYFPEIRPLVAGCAYSDCSHDHEPGCAVLEALERGEIDPERLDSYHRMRRGEFT